MIFHGKIFNYFRQNYLQPKHIGIYMSIHKFIFEPNTLNRHTLTLLTVFIISLSNSLFSQNKTNDFHMPTEFEQQQAVWFA